MSGYRIGHIIGAIVLGSVALFISYDGIKNLYKKNIKPLFNKVPLPSNYSVLSSLDQLNKLSAERIVLLITDSVPPILWADRDARDTFEQTQLQALNSLTKDKNITICWFNIDSAKKSSDLIKYLKNKGLLKKGLSLFKEGKLLKYEPINGKLNMNDKKTIRVVGEMLNDIS